MKFRVLILILWVGLLGSCEKEQAEKEVVEGKGSVEFKALLNSYNKGTLSLDPIKATFAGLKEYNADFPNYLSKSYKDSAIAFYQKYQNELKGYDDELLSPSENMSKAVLEWECDLMLKELSFRKELMPIDQMWSKNLVMGQLASGQSAQPFNTVEDYEAWLKRLDGYVIWMQTAEQRMKEGAKIRLILPTSLIIKVIPQLRPMALTEVEDHLFYSPIKQFPNTFTDEEKERLTTMYREMLVDKLIPAYRSLYEYVSTDYLDQGRNSSGINTIPNGDKYYAFSIQKYTTTTMTAAEIHQLGLDEVARILAEMEKVKEEVGFEGDMKSFFEFVRNDKKLMPYTQPEEVIDGFNSIRGKMKSKLDDLFNKKPETKFVVRRTEAFREASSSAEYNPGALDGSRPGVFYVPIPDATKYNVYGDEALFLHEAIPGHHYQMSLTQENDSLPDFRKTLWYSAYGEGWALYVESMGKELGLYKDPFQYFGMLSGEMHRAIRLVVDTGLHSKEWTREQAIQYCLDNEAESEASIVSEVERYMANPGQALSYKIGQLKILELRKKAKIEMGENFDIAEFHDQVLETGCVPLALLEDKIDNWIASKDTLEP